CGTSSLSVSPLLTRGLLHWGTWASAFFLFAYAVCFSFAYLGLSTGTGALILFGSVQMTMISIAIFRGERMSAIEWLGVIAAAGGLVYLLLPGVTAPPLNSALLMIVAGMAWGLYTLRGRGSGDPLADTTGNFIRAVPMIAVVTLLFLPNLHISGRGVLLAVLSGAVASGVGYTIWYAALKHHTATRAAVLQLPVPVLTAVLGIILIGEAATARLWMASAVILGGLAMTIWAKKTRKL
ncbi:MAG: DMT family transporter, partial [Pyrinomonadaceae bacterium]